MGKISCSNCKFFASQDLGYSEYTVTDTEIFCLKKCFGPIEESNIWTPDGVAYQERIEKFCSDKAANCQEYVELPKNVDQINLGVGDEFKEQFFQGDSEILEAAKSYFG